MCSRDLQPRELEAVRLKCLGYLAKEIADKMGITTNTVNTTLSHAREKTGTNNEIELYNYYIENHLGLNIRQMLMALFLVVILLPSIICHDNNLIRVRSSRVRRAKEEQIFEPLKQTA